MSLILIWGMKLPVVRIARMGGQYAKPRSKQTEIVDGKEVMSFRSVTSPKAASAFRKLTPDVPHCAAATT